MAPIPLERKQLILEDARERILEGWTLYQIAEKHGITSRTLSTWLHQLGDEYTELRQVWIDNMLLDASDSIDQSADTESGEFDAQRASIHLALAREKWKKATWYAERRDSQRYGQKTEHKQDLSLSITVNRALPEPAVIQADYVQITDELRKDEL